MAQIYNLSGDLETASETISTAVDIMRESTLHHFKFMNSEQRQNYWDKYNKDLILAYIIAHKSNNEGLKSSGNAAYNNALFSKGLLLASTIELNSVVQDSEDAQLIKLFKNVRITTNALNNNNLSIVEQDSLSYELSRLERELVLKSKEYGDFTRNLAVDWTQVQGALTENDVAVEFVDYQVDNEVHYAALVLRKGMEHPVMVELTTEDKIKHEMRNKEKIYYRNGARVLYDEIWAPIEQYMYEGDNVYFSPSGLLHQLNIEFFTNKEFKPANKLYNLHRVSSTRQLCIEHDNNESRTAVLYGGLMYDADSTLMVANSRSWDNSAIRTRSVTPLESSSTERFPLKYLEASKIEVNDIESKLTNNQIATTKFIEFAGNEESFKALSGQRIPIIHIATHGFFEPNEEASKHDHLKLQAFGDQQYTPRDNSMKRSGLIMSGAQKAWLREPTPEGVEDGILLSEEISTLDLRGTNLIVLSCCETGLGEITSEGVFGLQRAFKMAGVESIIMSLWKVDDKATSLMMQTFYDSFLTGKSRREAFLEAQQKVRDEFDEPFYWASFIMLD